MGNSLSGRIEEFHLADVVHVIVAGKMSGSLNITTDDNVLGMLFFENGKLTSYGFYEFHTQIQSRKKINQLKIDIKTSTVDLQNDLKLGLLRGDFEIQPLPK